VRIQFPKDALKRIQIGQSFAEYDLVREDPNVFVTTPASLVATQPDNKKCFFVGRRGSGKTAISYHILNRNRRAISIVPQVFDLVELPLANDEFRDTRQRPFKSVVCAFQRALVGELVKQWIQRGAWHFSDKFPNLNKERGLIENCEFDTRVINLVDEIFHAFNSANPRLWLRQINRAKEMIEEVSTIRENANFDYALLIDRLDESWDGSDSAIICLMALMHACVQLVAACPSLRPYLFIRENIFSRIRDVDNEFSRLETSVVFLDWSAEKLVEFVERRCVRPFNTKPALGGEAWSHFFEDSESFDSRTEILTFCQNRPRDVLTYVSFALESAISRGHQKIRKDDILNACERFSTSKLKDLADEFAENYPNIQLVLRLFYGLSTEYTIAAIENFIQKLLVDHNIAKYCKEWFYNHSTPHQFVGLFFSIGYFGVKQGKDWVYKTAGGDAAFMPSLLGPTTIQIHPAFHAALHLRNIILPEISDQTILQVTGILEDLPQGVSFDDYQVKLHKLYERLDEIPKGREGATEFEDFVGEIIKLCFFRALTNVQPKARTHSNVVIRDWIASNRAVSGFWEMVRSKYDATQVIWECKNYENLSADDFHQAAYYMGHICGRFIVMVHRAKDVDTSYYRHIERIAKDKEKGLVLLLTEKDIRVFLRQALNGKVKEDHINELYDRTVRAIG
jgi:hypothetical protein